MDSQAGLRIGTPEDLSLDGSLSNFFTRKGISFDQETGLFKIENQYDRQIKLSGHGQRYLMARKALLRNGINASRQADSPLSIKAVDNGFLISQEDKVLATAVTIEELLAEIVTR